MKDAPASHNGNSDQFWLCAAWLSETGFLGLQLGWKTKGKRKEIVWLACVVNTVALEKLQACVKWVVIFFEGWVAQ